MADLHRRTTADDPFLLQYQPSDLRIASEFLTTWLPFLSRDLCRHCTQNLSRRIHSLVSGSLKDGYGYRDADADDTYSLGSWKDGSNGWSEPVPKPSTSTFHGIDAGANPTTFDKTVEIYSNVTSHKNFCDDNCDNRSAGSLNNGDGYRDADADDTYSLGSWKDGSNGLFEPVSEPSTSSFHGSLKYGDGYRDVDADDMYSLGSWKDGSNGWP